MVVCNPIGKYDVDNLNKDNKKETIYQSKSIFLAGTIDSGNSNNWQDELIMNLINDYNLPNLTIYNPRRPSWPEADNNKEIEYQIKWEQEYLDKSDMIIMVLLDDSKSPISLLELGLYAQSHKLVVFCSNKFYRYDNVKLTCDKYNIPLYNTSNINKITKYIIDILKL